MKTPCMYRRCFTWPILAISLAAAAASAQSLPPAPVAPPAAEAKDETVLLSPFEVVAEDRGYQAFNTLSGTRLNSKLEDLGSSITVVTAISPRKSRQFTKTVHFKPNQ